MADCNCKEEGCPICDPPYPNPTQEEMVSLREQLKQAQEQHAEAVGLVGQYGLVNGRLEAELEQAQATIARQREWIKSAGHRPGCAALSCVAYSGLCGLHEKNDFHCGGLPEHDHKFQPGPCGCGWAEHVEEKS